MSRGVRGIELTAAGRAFPGHARLALTQAEAAAEAARRAAQRTRPSFAMDFLTGQEADWLPCSASILRDEPGYPGGLAEMTEFASATSRDEDEW
jgi:LysR family transcriptional regulator, hca operon transcriptional activator